MKADRETHPGTKLRPVNWSIDIETVRRLFQDYRQWLADHLDTATPALSRSNKGLEMVDKQIAELPWDLRPVPRRYHPRNKQG